MKEIKLSQHRKSGNHLMSAVALVDDEDFERLNEFKWCVLRKGNVFYAERRAVIDGARCLIRMHRVILNLTDPSILIDHIDRNGLNNQKYNLRECTKSQNAMNRGAVGLGTSKYKGVYWNKDRKKWAAIIQASKHKKFLGLFFSEEDAAMAYDIKAREMHGEFAKLNF